MHALAHTTAPLFRERTIMSWLACRYPPLTLYTWWSMALRLAHTTHDIDNRLDLAVELHAVSSLRLWAGIRRFKD